MDGHRLWRVHVTAWGRNLGIALTPGSTFAGTSWHTYGRIGHRAIPMRIPAILSPEEPDVVGEDEDWAWDKAEWLPPMRRDG